MSCSIASAVQHTARLAFKTDVRFQTGTEIETWLFRTCAMKNMQYNHRNFGVLQEIVVEEHDGDVLLYIGYGADSMFHRTYF